MLAERDAHMSSARGLFSITSVIVYLSVVSALQAQTPLGTSFAYQGQLKLSGDAVSATADFQFSLFDAPGSGSPPTGGNQIGATLFFDGGAGHAAPVTVAGGLFSAQLDFGSSAFQGDSRWLQIAVRSPSGIGSYMT